MAKHFFLRTFFLGLLITAVPVIVMAKKPLNSTKYHDLNLSIILENSLFQDSIPKKTSSGKKPEENNGIGKSDIKEVPKSRRQLKPRGVMDHIKIKPIRIMRPKIIKHKMLRL